LELTLIDTGGNGWEGGDLIIRDCDDNILVHTSFDDARSTQTILQCFQSQEGLVKLQLYGGDHPQESGWNVTIRSTGATLAGTVGQIASTCPVGECCTQQLGHNIHTRNISARVQNSLIFILKLLGGIFKF
jgi:hypothetical protein